jgi:hypothetical protein
VINRATPHNFRHSRIVVYGKEAAHFTHIKIWLKQYFFWLEKIPDKG